jgi:hypothetical protein
MAVLVFTAVYLLVAAVGGHHVSVTATLIDSLTAIHELDATALFSLRGILVFLEGIVGLVLEGTLVAMLVQRLRAGNG